MDITVSSAVGRFLDHCRSAKTLSPHTLRAYGTDLAHAATRLGGNATVSSIGRDELRGYVGGMLRDAGLKETSVKRRMATVTMTLDELKAERERVLARRNALVTRVTVGDRSVHYDLTQADKVLADLDRRIAQASGSAPRRRVLTIASKGL